MTEPVQKKNIFDNKFMQGLNKFGQKLGSNTFVRALQSGMMGTMGPIMVGAVAQVVTAILGPSMLKLITADSAVYQFLYAPYYITINAIGLWEAFMISYNYGKAKGLKPLNTGLIGVITFMLITGFDYSYITESGTLMLNASEWGGTGIFTAILVSWACVQIIDLCQKHHIYFKMPDIVPPALAEGFESIIPLTICVYVFFGINTLLKTTVHADLTYVVIGILSGPINVLTSSVGCVFILLIACVLWLFGIHGSMVVFSVLMAPLMSAYTANAAVVTAAGGDPSVLTYADNFTPLFACMSAMACCGGTGDTFGLVLDSLLFGKSEQAKAVGKAALVPGIFNINEPATFGYPIMYNPTLGLPYVLTPIIIYLLELLCYRLGWLQIPFVLSFSLVPIGVAEFITTLSWKNVLFSFLMIPVSMLIFLPFFKVYDNQKLKEEKEAKAAEEAAATK
jgi:PTS system cellobiose-specific IIC component